MTVQDGSTGLYQYDMKSGEFSDLITGQAYAAVAVADDGTLYVSHSTDNTIERVVRTGDGWSRERLAGNGTAGYADGPFAEAQFSFPRGWLSARWETSSWPGTVRGTWPGMRTRVSGG